MPRKPPKYQRHQHSGRAFVEFGRKRIYLGLYDSADSWEMYHRLIAERHAGRIPSAAAPTPQPGCTVAVLVWQFFQHAQGRYVKDGKETSEPRLFKAALRPVIKLYGNQRAADFGPLALIACRKQLEETGICRKSVNKQIGRIRQVWKWGASRELVPASTWQALLTVEGLRAGQSKAPERPPVLPVEPARFDATRKALSPTLAAMVRLQLLTGMRPGEVCSMRSCDVDTSLETWEYRPQSHKTQHHSRSRLILIGPIGQDVLRYWLRGKSEAPVFQPRVSKEWYLAQRRENRQTPLTPSQRARTRVKNPKRKPGIKFSSMSYGKAIKAACLRAGIPVWTPNQIRHYAATRIRAEYGIEAARVILGHASAVTSEIYAERDRVNAAKIMQEFG